MEAFWEGGRVTTVSPCFLVLILIKPFQYRVSHGTINIMSKGDLGKIRPPGQMHGSQIAVTDYRHAIPTH